MSAFLEGISSDEDLSINSEEEDDDVLSDDIVDDWVSLGDATKTNDASAPQPYSTQSINRNSNNGKSTNNNSNSNGNSKQQEESLLLPATVCPLCAMTYPLRLNEDQMLSLWEQFPFSHLLQSLYDSSPGVSASPSPSPSPSSSLTEDLSAHLVPLQTASALMMQISRSLRRFHALGFAQLVKRLGETAVGLVVAYVRLEVRQMERVKDHMYREEEIEESNGGERRKRRQRYHSKAPAALPTKSI